MNRKILGFALGAMVLSAGGKGEQIRAGDQSQDRPADRCKYSRGDGEAGGQGNQIIRPIRRKFVAGAIR
jgi:hypothetical protein